MWNLFTERARRTIFLAQDEAVRLKHVSVSTEHLLLGLLREQDTVAARILDRMGINSTRLRKDVEKQAGRREIERGVEMNLTAAGKQVINSAYEESKRIGNRYIGTEHLLLGLIRDSEGLAGRVLVKHNVGLEAARKEVMSLQDSDA